ncbi:MAG TPA: hypothetical protein VJ326_09045 [Thermoplasmata archaeon]|jgi:hypothetical protein|nr:hypothetical protein [Thermoplasmata archaeon]
MTSERLRAILGVWMPMAIGVGIIATSLNFYLTANLAGGILIEDLESWRLVCTAGASFLGGVMILSTYGRLKKTRAARAPAPSEAPKGPE